MTKEDKIQIALGLKTMHQVQIKYSFTKEVRFSDLLLLKTVYVVALKGFHLRDSAKSVRDKYHLFITKNISHIPLKYIWYVVSVCNDDSISDGPSRLLYFNALEFNVGTYD